MLVTSCIVSVVHSLPGMHSLTWCKRVCAAEQTEPMARVWFLTIQFQYLVS